MNPTSAPCLGPWLSHFSASLSFLICTVDPVVCVIVWSVRGGGVGEWGSVHRAGAVALVAQKQRCPCRLRMGPRVGNRSLLTAQAQVCRVLSFLGPPGAKPRFISSQRKGSHSEPRSPSFPDTAADTRRKRSAVDSKSVLKTGHRDLPVASMGSAVVLLMCRVCLPSPLPSKPFTGSLLLPPPT